MVVSKETVKKFYEELKSNKAMVEELQKQADSVKEKSPENAAALVVKFAAARGYDFTAEDLRAFEAEIQELGSDDLDKVNAAWSFCWLLGWGWGDTKRSMCRGLGAGVVG